MASLDELKNRVDDASRVRTTIDVVSKEDESIGLFRIATGNQVVQRHRATVDVTDDESPRGRCHVHLASIKDGLNVFCGVASSLGTVVAAR